MLATAPARSSLPSSHRSMSTTPCVITILAIRVPPRCDARVGRRSLFHSTATDIFLGPTSPRPVAASVSRDEGFESGDVFQSRSKVRTSNHRPRANSKFVEARLGECSDPTLGLCQVAHVVVNRIPEKRRHVVLAIGEV